MWSSLNINEGFIVEKAYNIVPEKRGNMCDPSQHQDSAFIAMALHKSTATVKRSLSEKKQIKDQLCI